MSRATRGGVAVAVVALTATLGGCSPSQTGVAAVGRLDDGRAVLLVRACSGSYTEASVADERRLSRASDDLSRAEEGTAAERRAWRAYRAAFVQGWSGDAAVGVVRIGLLDGAVRGADWRSDDQRAPLDADTLYSFTAIDPESVARSLQVRFRPRDLDTLRPGQVRSAARRYADLGAFEADACGELRGR